VARSLRQRAGSAGPVLHLPLLINRSQSALTNPELASVLAEINRIWRQAGICFEARDLHHGYGSRPCLVLSFVEADEPFVNGYFEDERHIWAQDAPRLALSPTPAELPAARTAAHELGHALDLRHVPRTPTTMDGLMNTGFDGFHLTATEVATARQAATRYARPMAQGHCRPPEL
jgi:hypothetical protein